MALSLAKTEEQKRILEIVHVQRLFTHPCFMAPDVPWERVEAMRKAFAKLLSDEEFLAEAEKQKLIVSSMSGAEPEAMIRKIYATPLGIIEKVRNAIPP